MVPETSTAWALPTTAGELFTSQCRKESTENWNTLALTQKIIQAPNPGRPQQDTGYLSEINYSVLRQIWRNQEGIFWMGVFCWVSAEAQADYSQRERGECHVRQDDKQAQANFSDHGGGLCCDQRDWKWPWVLAESQPATHTGYIILAQRTLSAAEQDVFTCIPQLKEKSFFRASAGLGWTAGSRGYSWPLVQPGLADFIFEPRMKTQFAEKLTEQNVCAWHLESLWGWPYPPPCG